jgi:rod shape determining protein RodA
MIRFRDVDASFITVGLVISLLTLVSIVFLRTISPQLFPSYYFYYLVSFVIFFIFLRIDFDVLKLFSAHLYILSIIALITPLLIGQVTRGAVRWIPLGELSVQPSELVRPFLFLYFSKCLIGNQISFRKILKSLVVFLLPFGLILVQPSLGVSFLTAVGFAGVVLASSISKKQLFIFSILILLILPLVWLFLAPYQKERIIGFVDPYKDPRGIGYNSIQSMISVGSGGLLGRGLGKGVQTQLSFLPERHSDFIFASIAEELGFVGAGFVLLLFVILFLVMTSFIERSGNSYARAFITAVVFSLMAETFIHLGMNMGLLPITGVPLPFVSAGGSSLLGNSISIAMVLKARSIR